MRRLWFSLVFALAVPVAALGIEKGTIVDGIAAAEDPTQTYAVYLPTTWDAGAKHPLLLVFDPRSRGVMAAEIFREAAEARGWIVASSNNTMSDGPWEPNVRAVNAMWPDVMRRFAVDPARIYAAGFSGGAILAWATAQGSGRVAGIIGVGGHLPQELRGGEIGFAHFGAAGRRDFNYLEMHDVDRYVASKGAPRRLEIFDGRHEWIPAELARVAIDWLEVVAMQSAIRPRDAALARSIHEQEVEAARGLERAGRIAEAHERWSMIARTFDGFVETDEAKGRMDSLSRSKEMRAQIRAETRWTGWERQRIEASQRVIAKIADPEVPMTSARLGAELGLADLKRRAEREDAEGSAAGRVLASMFAQASFYLPRRLMESEEFSKAAVVLELARTIQETWPVDYNLAAMYARTGRKDAAFELLDAAVERGFSRPDQLRADEDFSALRDDPRFAALLGRIAAE